MLGKLYKGNQVYLLRKSLYELWQTGRQWHEKLREAFPDFRVTAFDGDPCSYYKERGEDIVLIDVYVDDLLVPSKNVESIIELEETLSSRFDDKDLGSVDYCLEVKFTRKGDRLTLNQRHYIIDLVKHFNMTNSKPVNTPIDVNKLTREPKFWDVLHIWH
ncbi:hypothetical protein KM043_017672 [Ampulex compressa]|nr:hypothetical protein KM043_017672 [Ampulex compressa]